MRLYQLVDKITRGEADEGTIPLITALAEMMYKSPLCPLGQTAPLPIMSTLKYFRDEYDAHINEKRCPTGTCKAIAARVQVAD